MVHAALKLLLPDFTLHSTLRRRRGGRRHLLAFGWDGGYRHIKGARMDVNDGVACASGLRPMMLMKGGVAMFSGGAGSGGTGVASASSKSKRALVGSVVTNGFQNIARTAKAGAPSDYAVQRAADGAPVFRWQEKDSAAALLPRRRQPGSIASPGAGGRGGGLRNAGRLADENVALRARIRR